MAIKTRALAISRLLQTVLCSFMLCSCNNSKDVSFKSAGVTQTFSQGPGAAAPDFANYIYPDATTSGSVSADESDEQSKFLMLSSASPVDAVSKWYQDKLKADKWKITNQQEQGKLTSITGAKDNSELSVMITEDAGNTNISLSLSKQLDNSFVEDTNRENFVPNKDTPPTD